MGEGRVLCLGKRTHPGFSPFPAQCSDPQTTQPFSLLQQLPVGARLYSHVINKRKKQASK